ncbi:hypothetical protein CDES_14245 (plasmid) [Corynebacterium deserti GIMN1.010]|uniref:Uncharacterized protein n=1 Tax=Corynebacterium deserti GIMN1.010 TaxID=931089 RepID=A0A0M4CIH0_9CORY|nr:hypothetical protein CDES_14245 [Corynebacterium deserti GIMN1.010]
MFGVAVDFDDGVIDINEDVITGRNINWDQGRGLCGQVDQESGGHRIQLADMSEGKRPEEGTQGGWGVDLLEQSVHTAVAQQVHVIDGVGTGNHPGNKGGDLCPWVGTFITCDAQPVLSQGGQVGFIG